MKNRNMKIIGAFAVLALVLGLGIYSQFRGGRDTGLTQADKILKELSSMPAINNVKTAFKGEEFQKVKKVDIVSKPKTNKKSYVFSTADVAEEPGYINDLRYLGIEVKGHKEISSISNVMDKYYAEQGYPKLEKKMNTKIPQDAIPGQLIVKSVDWQDDGTYKVSYNSVNVNPEQEVEAIDVIKDDPNVVSVEPNIKIKVQALFTVTTQDVPKEENDPYFDKQWALEKIKVPDAWETEKGNKNVKVAIIDTGIDLEHSDLVNNIDLDSSYDYVNDDNEPEDESETSHGTHIAGIIAAGTNDIGIQGVMQNANLIILKILKSDVTDVDSLTLATAITDAINKGAKVINMSWGTDTDLMTESDILKDAFNSAFSSSILLVAAAGNHKDVLYPAKYPEILAVGGTDKEDNRWVSSIVDSSTGTEYESAYGEEIDISAPAEDIYSTIVRKQDGSVEDGYGYLSGTSMSAAFVSGLAGLLLSKNPDLTKEELIQTIEDNVDEVTTDSDKPIGTGRINAQKALEAAAGDGGGDETALINIICDPQEPEVGEPVNFVAYVSYNGDREITKYVCDFGDGNTEEGNREENMVGSSPQGIFGNRWTKQGVSIRLHTYEKEGLYTVKLTIEDDQGIKIEKSTDVKVWKVEENEIVIKGMAYKSDPIEGCVRAPDVSVAIGLSRDKKHSEGRMMYRDEGKPMRVVKISKSDKNGKFIIKFSDLDPTEKYAVSIIKPDIYLKKGRYVPILEGLVPGKSYDLSLAGNVRVYVGEEGREQIIIQPGDSVQFYADVLTLPIGGNLSDVKFDWDFGDGETSDEMNPIHTYQKGGSYHVVLYLLSKPYENMIGGGNLVRVIVWDKIPEYQIIVKGKVYDEGGNPQKGAHVRMVAKQKYLTGTFGDNIYSLVGTSDENGDYKVRIILDAIPLPDTKYFITLFKPQLIKDIITDAQVGQSYSYDIRTAEGERGDIGSYDDSGSYDNPTTITSNSDMVSNCDTSGTGGTGGTITNRVGDNGSSGEDTGTGDTGNPTGINGIIVENAPDNPDDYYTPPRTMKKFTADISDGIGACYWDFGDGYSGRGKSVIHDYGTAGYNRRYIVKLKAKDNNGVMKELTKTIEIGYPGDMCQRDRDCPKHKVADGTLQHKPCYRNQCVECFSSADCKNGGVCIGNTCNFEKKP